MAKKYVSNENASPIWVGGVMIAPGEGREVDVPDAHEAPADAGGGAEVVDPDIALHELLGGTVAGVTAALGGLSAETLQRLQVLEAEGKNRKGVLEALGDALIALADAKLQSDAEILAAGQAAGVVDGAVDGAADPAAGGGESDPTAGA